MAKIRFPQERKKRSKFRKKLDKWADAIRHKYWRTVPYDYRPWEIWYRLKCWAWRRHSTVRARYLPHTWVDRVAVLPHLMFEVLSQFIEKECMPDEIVDWKGSGHMVTVDGVERNVRDEMQILYDWWHQSYNKEYEEVHEILWKEIRKHPADREFIPVNKAHEEVPDEDAEWYLWEQEFPTPEDEEIYDRCIMACSKLERMQREKLEEMMHRLVKLTPYLWT